METKQNDQALYLAKNQELLEAARTINKLKLEVRRLGGGVMATVKEIKGSKVICLKKRGFPMVQLGKKKAEVVFESYDFLRRFLENKKEVMEETPLTPPVPKG